MSRCEGLPQMQQTGFNVAAIRTSKDLAPAVPRATARRWPAPSLPLSVIHIVARYSRKPPHFRRGLRDQGAARSHVDSAGPKMV